MNSIAFLFGFFILWGVISFLVGWYACRDNAQSRHHENRRTLGAIVGLKCLTTRHDETGSDVLRSKGL